MWRRLLSFQLSPHTGFFLKPSTSLFYDFQSFFFFFAVIAVFCGTFGGTAGRRGTSNTGHQIIDENSKQIICVQQVLAPLPRENTSLAAVTVFLSNMKPVFFHFRHNDGTVRITRTYIYGHVLPLGCLAFFFFFFWWLSLLCQSCSHTRETRVGICSCVCWQLDKEIQCNHSWVNTRTVLFWMINFGVPTCWENDWWWVVSVKAVLIDRACVAVSSEHCTDSQLLKTVVHIVKQRLGLLAGYDAGYGTSRLFPTDIFYQSPTDTQRLGHSSLFAFRVLLAHFGLAM